MATEIMPSSSHGCMKDCEEIHDSSPNLSHLVLGLATRSRLELRRIRETYMEMYKEDLITRLQNVQLSHTSSALIMWMIDPHERDAIVAREALEQEDEVDYDALFEILVGRKSSHIVLIKQAYRRKFGRNLDQDIINIEPPQPSQKILLALATSHNAHHEDVCRHIAKCDAKRLFETGEGKSGGSVVEEAVVLEIFSKRSIPQLKLTFHSYRNIYGHDYIKSLSKQNSGEFETTLKRVIKCMCNPPKYYAKMLFTSLEQITRKVEERVARAIVSRADTDMDEIQKIFLQKYGIGLEDAIRASIVSGVCGEFLVALASRRTPKAPEYHSC